MGRFIALRELKTEAGTIVPGSFVPGVEKWPHHIVRSNINVGNIYDLHRVEVLNGESLAAQRRQDALIQELMARRQLSIIAHPDEPGRFQLVNAADGSPVPLLDAPAEEAPKPAAPKPQWPPAQKENPLMKPDPAAVAAARYALTAEEEASETVEVAPAEEAEALPQLAAAAPVKPVKLVKKNKRKRG